MLRNDDCSVGFFLAKRSSQADAAAGGCRCTRNGRVWRTTLPRAYLDKEALRRSIIRCPIGSGLPITQRLSSIPRHLTELVSTIPVSAPPAPHLPRASRRTMIFFHGRYVTPAAIRTTEVARCPSSPARPWHDSDNACSVLLTSVATLRACACWHDSA